MRKAHYTHPPFSVYKESKPARPSLSVSPLSLCLLSLSLSFYMRPIIMLSWVALLLFFFLILRAAWITISCYYLNPRRIRKAMLRQGVSGPEPRFWSEISPLLPPSSPRPPPRTWNLSTTTSWAASCPITSSGPKPTVPILTFSSLILHIFLLPY